MDQVELRESLDCEYRQLLRQYIQELSPLGPRNKVLAITKRTADLCATQSLLYAGGYQLVTATSIATACSMIRILPICGVIMCDHSWTESERSSIACEMQKLHLPMMNCPGCTGCDESCGKAGEMKDVLPLTNLMATLGRTPL